jgi:flagellar basal-body rod protein FlgG
MSDVLAVALAAMQADSSRLDRVALNLANATTPGYKREVMAARPFADLFASEVAAQSPGASGDARPSFAAADGALVRFDVRPGPLKMTGEPLDLALTGDGFFEVSTPNGTAYTRQGNLHVDPSGRLVTAQGDAVMGVGGEIFLTTTKPVIDGSGNVTEPFATTGPASVNPGKPVAQIKVVRFENPATLQRLGAGLLRAGQAETGVAGGTPQVKQGALESSNVDSMREMAQLMETTRHFETMQKVAQGYDDIMSTAIRKLGDLA